MKKPIPGTLFRAIVGLLSVCASVSAASSAKAAQDQPAASSDYMLRPMDLVKVQVFQEPELDRELRVSQNRSIKLPLIGVVDLRKHSVREAETLIAELYNKDYLVNPQINITILEYSPRTVNVLGAVNNPGSVVITTEHKFSLLDVIARSGGFSRLANRDKLSLTRTMADGETQNFTINGDQLVSGDANTTWTVQDGDVIFVPERVL
ncbi:MAG TPA: polysaccharide biosynthesis/export family protein [Opitutaceae bacterium]